MRASRRAGRSTEGRANVRLIAELQRRNVLRVAAAYAVVAWLLIQVSDTIFPRLGLPDWTVTLVIALLGVGFPVALLLAWAYELTPEGLRRTGATDAEAATARTTGRHWNRWIVAALIAAVALLLAGRQWLDGREPAPAVVPTVPGADRSMGDVPAIAVLPFENYSPDSSDAYFAGGMTEEITNQLSRLSGLRVMSRTAVTRALEGSRPLAAVATELGVGSVLSGSVRKAGERVRISTQLVDPRSGQQLWTREFDREIADVFEIQREVALAIVGTLRTTMTEPEQARISTAPTDDPEAYELFLEASQLQGSAPESNREAIVLLRQALARDPRFEKAWSRLAWRYQWEYWHGDASGAALAMEYSGKALELDPASPDAHAARAAAYAALERISEVRAAFARTLELDPEFPIALMDGGLAAMAQGDLAVALQLSARALRRSPNVPNVRYHVGHPMLALDDDVRLTAWLKLAALQGLSMHRLDILEILLQVAQGRRREALAALDESLGRWDHPELRDFAADIRVFLGEYAAARADLEPQVQSAPDVEGFWATSRSARTNYAFVLGRLGEHAEAERQFAEARRYIERLIESGSDSASRRAELAAIHAVLGDVELAIDWLEQAYDAGYRASRFLAQDPMFESVRHDRRFTALLERMNEAKSRERAKVETEGMAAEIDAMIASGRAGSR